MVTTSEIAVTATIWVLTAAGGFFGTRAALRKKRLKCEITKSKLQQTRGVNDRSTDC